MNQQSFGFDAATIVGATQHRRIETPAYRANDPISSELAAEEVTTSGQRQANIEIVAALVRKHPGLTSAELSRHCDLGRTEVARRLPDARTGGAVANAPPNGLHPREHMRHCAITKRLSLTWWPA